MINGRKTGREEALFYMDDENENDDDNGNSSPYCMFHHPYMGQGPT